MVAIPEMELAALTGGRGQGIRLSLVSARQLRHENRVRLPIQFPIQAIGSQGAGNLVQQGVHLLLVNLLAFFLLYRGDLVGVYAVAVTKDGKTSDNWRKERGDLLTIPGIMRTPLFIDGGKRVILPSHGGSTSIWISDDGGLNWRKYKNEIKSPPHTVGGIHKGLRWQNSGVEATVVELKNGTLWALVRTSQDYYY